MGEARRRKARGDYPTKRWKPARVELDGRMFEVDGRGRVFVIPVWRGTRELTRCRRRVHDPEVIQAVHRQYHEDRVTAGDQRIIPAKSAGLVVPGRTAQPAGE